MIEAMAEGECPASNGSRSEYPDDRITTEADEGREWVEVAFADPARATEWIAQHGVLVGHVQVVRAHRGQAALRLFLTARQRRALPGRGPNAPSIPPGALPRCSSA